MKRYVIEIDQPGWDEEDFDWLEERLLGVVANLVPGDHYSFQIHKETK